jgi:hypothetical protein
MALKQLSNGTYEIRNMKDAVAALNLFQTLTEEIDELMQEHGITEMMQDSVELKKSVTKWAVDTKTERIDYEGHHAALISQNYDARFIGTKDEIPTDRNELYRIGAVDEHGREVRKIVPLRTILKRKFKKNPAKVKELWSRVTVRVVDKEAVEEIISEGILSVDEIAPCFVEKVKAPYLRSFED